MWYDSDQEQGGERSRHKIRSPHLPQDVRSEVYGFWSGLGATSALMGNSSTKAIESAENTWPKASEEVKKKDEGGGN